FEMGVQSIKKADCPSCGDNATYPFLEYDQQTKSAVFCGREAVQIRPPQQQERNLPKIAARLEKLGGKVEINEFLFSFSVGEERLVLFTDGLAMIHGTNDMEYACTLYYRYFS